MVETPAQNGQIDGLGDARGWVLRLLAELSAQAERHKRRNQRDGEQGREDEGESLGPGERAEHAAFLCFKQEDRQERHHNNDERIEERGADLLCCADQDAIAAPSPLGASVRSARWRYPFSTMTMAASISTPMASAKSAERHDVRADMQVVHGDERRHHGDGQRENGNQRGTEVKEEHDADKADDDGFGDQVALQGMDRFVDEPGAVVASDDLNAGRQRRRKLLKFALSRR